MLKTEQNTQAIERRILAAAQDHSDTYTHGFFTAAFEHGQWWLTCGSCGAQWSVCDATGGPSVDGFDFEEVTQGEECCGSCCDDSCDQSDHHCKLT